MGDKPPDMTMIPVSTDTLVAIVKFRDGKVADLIEAPLASEARFMGCV